MAKTFCNVCQAYHNHGGKKARKPGYLNINHRSPEYWVAYGKETRKLQKQEIPA